MGGLSGGSECVGKKEGWMLSKQPTGPFFTCDQHLGSISVQGIVKHVIVSPIHHFGDRRLK
jgi:hypothetical protein